MPTPDQNMLTPSKISVKPNVMPLVVPADLILSSIVTRYFS